MKFAALTAAAIITATSASAADLGATGISIGAELDSYYDVDLESFQSVLTPKVGYEVYGVDLTAETDLKMVTNDVIVAQDAFDVAPVISLGAGYTVDMGVEARAYGEVDINTDGFDTDAARVGLTFAF